MREPDPDRADDVELMPWFRAGDEQAGAELVRRHDGLVKWEARRFIASARRLSFDDLVAEGRAGLLEAFHRFDATRGVQFSTYACFWIRKWIFAAIHNDSLVRVPKYLSTRTARKSPDLVRAARRAKGLVISIDDERTDDPELGMVPSFEARLLTEELHELLGGALDRLGKLDRQILIGSYGLDGRAPRGDRAPAGELGLHRVTMARRRDSALRRLRRELTPAMGGA